MAKQASKMMIGGFLIIALFLLIASLVVFSTTKFFTKTQKFVLYFNEPVRGLDVGSPVLFQGVSVGSVVSIDIIADPVKQQAEIPVIIQIELDRFKFRKPGEILNPQKDMPLLIKRGFRGMLVMQSLVSGKFLIELDFYPDSPLVLKNINKEYIEIPTIPSTTSKLTRALDKLDIEAIQKKLEFAMDGIGKLTNNPDLAASIQRLKETLGDARKLVKRVDRQVDPLATDTRKTIKDIGTLARNLNGRVGGVATSLEKTLADARGVISPDSQLVVDLENTLKEFSAMSRSVRTVGRLSGTAPRDPDPRQKETKRGRIMSTIFSRGLRVVLPLAAILLGGCVRSPEPKFYTLTPVQDQFIGRRSNPAQNAVIGIGPVKLADYLDKSQIVTRTSDEQLVKSEFNRWVGSFKDNFINVLADNLGFLLSDQQIYLYPFRPSVPIDYQITLDVIRCDGRLGDAA